MRIGIDGERGFALGVESGSSSWLPRRLSDASLSEEGLSAAEAESEEKRKKFLATAPWADLLQAKMLLDVQLVACS